MSSMDSLPLHLYGLDPITSQPSCQCLLFVSSNFRTGTKGSEPLDSIQDISRLSWGQSRRELYKLAKAGGHGERASVALMRW